MWLDHNTQTATQPWNFGDVTAPIEAAYRRGVLRARVNIQDLSCSTATIDCLDNPVPGSRVWLTLPGLESREAVVESCEGFRAFLVFAIPFHPAVLDAFLNGAIRRYC